MAHLDSTITDLGQVTIAGTGLLGGSVGLALRQAGYAGRIVGVGRRQVTLDAAVAAGCIDAGAADLAAAVRAGGPSQLVILATPLGAFADMVEKLATVQDERLVVTDVGSVKAQVCELARAKLPHPRRFVGSHPMAGGEQHGPQHARADLFAGRPCVITRAATDDGDAVALVSALWRGLGMKVIEMDVAEHDRKVAQISHLPHLAAALLVELAVRRGGLDIASTGFGDTTRVASGDVRVWTDIFLANRLAVGEAAEGLADALRSFAAMLDAGDAAAVSTLLDAAKRRRDDWLKQDTFGQDGSEP